MPTEQCKEAMEHGRTLIDYIPLIGLMAGSTNQPYWIGLFEKLLIPFIGAAMAIYVSQKLMEQDVKAVKATQAEMKVTQKEMIVELKHISTTIQSIDKSVALNTQRLNLNSK